MTGVGKAWIGAASGLNSDGLGPLHGTKLVRGSGGELGILRAGWVNFVVLLGEALLDLTATHAWEICSHHQAPLSSHGVAAQGSPRSQDVIMPSATGWAQCP